jgi:hypothetical protein
LRMLIWPEASNAQNSIAAVSADGSTVCVLKHSFRARPGRAIAVVLLCKFQLSGLEQAAIEDRRMLAGQISPLKNTSPM